MALVFERVLAAPRDRSASLSILIADDDQSLRAILVEALGAVGHRVQGVGDGERAAALAKEQAFHVLVADVRLPGIDGLTLFRQVRRESPKTEVILTTAFASVTDAVAALREGVCDYIAKPFDVVRFALETVGRIAERRAVLDELERAGALLKPHDDASPIVGQSPAIMRLMERLSTISESDAPVLITGETGTGKELIARSLHEHGHRRNRPFVAVNCAAFPEMLLEAELFGHERGAFTGAFKKRDGRFKAADGGTLFLDEVAEIPLPAQAKLLRVLQEACFEPLGTNQSVSVDVRIISATNLNPKEAMAVGKFREDLYYRLNVLDLHLPPLRERAGDLPLLVEHFLRVFTSAGQPLPSIAPRAWAALAKHPFPGNVRELGHVIERGVLLAHGREIDLEHLPPDLSGMADGVLPIEEEGFRPLAVAVRQFEREYILRAIREAGGTRQRAADLLGISRKNLWEKLKVYGLPEGETNGGAS